MSIPRSSAAHVDHVEQLGRLVDHGAQRPALADRADPTDDVPRRAFGARRLAHDRLLRPDGSGHTLHRELAAHRHDRHDQLFVGDDHERLEHLVVVESERNGGLSPEVVEILAAFVLVDRVGDPGGIEGHHCRRHGHDSRTPRRLSGRPVRLSIDPSTSPADYDYRHRIRVRFVETDAMGIVHHSNYLHYFEETRVEYLRHIGHPFTEWREAGLESPVLESFVQYRQPLEFDELIDVHLPLAEVTRATFQMAYLVTVDDADGVPGVRATGVTVHGCVTTAGRPTRLPAWLTTMASR